jgi:hypothetical protein
MRDKREKWFHKLAKRLLKIKKEGATIAGRPFVPLYFYGL